jgi:uncharacterized protein involved in tolerance to divalent cations
MSHPLLRKGTHGNGPQQNTQAQQALNRNMWTSSIYVGRRKVWEGRAGSEQEAFALAKTEQTKYEGANPEVKVKKVKPVK